MSKYTAKTYRLLFVETPKLGISTKQYIYYIFIHKEKGKNNKNNALKQSQKDKNMIYVIFFFKFAANQSKINNYEKINVNFISRRF